MPSKSDRVDSASSGSGSPSVSRLPSSRIPGDVVVRHDVPFAELTTLRVGGPARRVVECRRSVDVPAVLAALDDAGEDAMVLAGGSNVLVGEAGFDGTVVLLRGGEVSIAPDGVVRADAGYVWDALVEATVAAGLGGLECLSGIPGGVGATPVQNVGAYGVEVSSVLRGVTVYDRSRREVVDVDPADLGLGYRTSRLKHQSREVVLAVEFGLVPGGRSASIAYRELATCLGVEPGERVAAEAARECVLGLRRGKGMVLDAADPDTYSAGSFFTNPIVGDAELPGVLERVAARTGGAVPPRYPAEGGTKLSAAWLIERAGFAKGYPGADAPARLSTKHTLALTNRGFATASDVLELAARVRAGVYEAFGVSLHPEPVLVGCSLE